MVASAVVGCGSSKSSTNPSLRGVEAAERSVRGAGQATSKSSSGAALTDRPAALVGNETITWNELQTPMAEAVGAALLEEVAMDRLISREMQVRGMAFDENSIEREQDLLVSTLTLAGGLEAGQQGDLVEQLRRSRGLGPHRYAALLRRNAMLRQMVRSEVEVSRVDIEQAYEIRYGQRFQTRLILTRTEREAADAAARIRNGDRFADVAATLSIDSSASRGGLIGAISPADPSFPLALRKAISSATAGATSPVTALEQGYAIVVVEQIVPPTGDQLDAVAGTLEREVRLVRERAAMDRLASQLLRATKITVMDPSLDWSWRGRPETPR